LFHKIKISPMSNKKKKIKYEKNREEKKGEKKGKGA
jgi:hypothetical protein